MVGVGCENCGCKVTFLNVSLVFPTEFGIYIYTPVYVYVCVFVKVVKLKIFVIDKNASEGTSY